MVKRNLLKLAVVLTLALVSINANAGQIFVVLRFDDYGGEALTEFEHKLIRACDAHGISVTIGVVPFLSQGEVENPAAEGEMPLRTKKVDLLADLVRRNKLEVAQHGYSHRTRSAHYLSEFQGLPTDVQVERIAKGKTYLE